jgi:hypothetical protein
VERANPKRKPRVIPNSGTVSGDRYAPQAMGGDATQHIHTIYRDRTNDYGARWINRK